MAWSFGLRLDNSAVAFWRDDRIDLRGGRREVGSDQEKDQGDRKPAAKEMTSHGNLLKGNEGRI